MASTTTARLPQESAGICRLTQTTQAEILRSVRLNFLSVNGKFRDECLNEHWFQSMHQARFAIAEWRRDYNEVRPHSSIGRIPPARFAELHRRGAAMRFIHPLTLESTKLATRTSTLRLVRQQGAGQSPLSPTKPASARRVALWRTLTGYFKAWSPCIFPLLHL